MQKENKNLVIGALLIVFGALTLFGNLDILNIETEFFIGLVFWASCVFFINLFKNEKRFLYLILASIAGFIGFAIVNSSLNLVDEQWTGVLLFAIIGSLFMYGYVLDNTKWGLLIPAGVNYTLGTIVLLEMIPSFDDDILGSVFFFGIGLTFGYLYLIKDQNNKLDWAKVPAIILILFSGFLLVLNVDSFLMNILFPLLLIALGFGLIMSGLKRNQSVNTAK